MYSNADRGIIIDQAPFRRYIHQAKNRVAAAGGNPRTLAPYNPRVMTFVNFGRRPTTAR
jgi:hypothetical protein